MNKKISLIGSGQIGGTIAQIMATKSMGEIVLVDIAVGMPQGKALDISQMIAISKSNARISGHNDYTNINNSDVIIVTAGIPRKPGMSRSDLVEINSSIISEISKEIKHRAPNAFVIIITNPLDAMTWTALKITKFQSNKIVGMAGVLDSARFASFLSAELNVDISSIKAMVLGGHGDSMLPLPKYTTISGIPIASFIKNNFITQEKLDNIIQRTRNAGAEIVNLLKTGSAFYAPAAAAIVMAEAYLYDKKQIVPATTYLKGEYGRNNLCIGVPVIIGAKGVEKIIELELTAKEKDMFNKSADDVEELINTIKI
ncbi:Malate dehydrogenase [Candidatus Xenohaliotis californiensis]|uniref:Malate dehydrogenase n=1 Tax=Candidatus Xenohaliotis californiensis TaxID=84677 RepID=A0ABM9N891_9RICK|nr:Malate dehydrogenase [Candidatus Xenohaliotis californiensis]